MQQIKHFFYFLRFITNLCVPMVVIILLAIIDNLRSNENKVKTMIPKTMIPVEEGIKWWERASFWISIAKIGLPLAYMLVSLTIVMPGLINIAVGG